MLRSFSQVPKEGKRLCNRNIRIKFFQVFFPPLPTIFKLKEAKNIVKSTLTDPFWIAIPLRTRMNERLKSLLRQHGVHILLQRVIVWQTKFKRYFLLAQSRLELTVNVVGLLNCVNILQHYRAHSTRRYCKEFQSSVWPHITRRAGLIKRPQR